MLPVYHPVLIVLVYHLIVLLAKSDSVSIILPIYVINVHLIKLLLGAHLNVSAAVLNASHVQVLLLIVLLVILAMV